MGTLKNASVDECLLSDHRVVLVVRVVGVSHLSVGSEFKLEELVTELALVADVVSDVEIFGTGHSLSKNSRNVKIVVFCFVLVIDNTNRRKKLSIRAIFLVF